MFRLFGGEGGQDVPGVSDGRHPLVTILGILRPQLQGFLVLMAEVNGEVMLHGEEDSSGHQGVRPALGRVLAATPARCRLVLGPGKAIPVNIFKLD